MNKKDNRPTHLVLLDNMTSSPKSFMKDICLTERRRAKVQNLMSSSAPDDVKKIS